MTVSVSAARGRTADGMVGPITVEIVDGWITSVAPADGGAPDWTLAPGFVDLQVNGHDAVDVAHADGEDWDRLDDVLLAQGVTSWCPTLVTAPLDAYGAAIGRLRHRAQRPGGPSVLG